MGGDPEVNPSGHETPDKATDVTSKDDPIHKNQKTEVETLQGSVASATASDEKKKKCPLT